MNELHMELAGDDSVGWRWRVAVDDLLLYESKPLARNDLACALFEIQKDDSRENRTFASLSDEELFFILEGFFFGGLGDALRPAAEAQVWARHLISPALPTVYTSRMYLVGHGPGEERLLASRKGQTHSFRIAAGSFDEQLRKARDVLESGSP